jgi:hypothetical protein
LLLRPRGTVVLVILALTPYLVYLGHPLFSEPAINMIFCHACQLGKHTRLPFCSSSHCTEHAFDLMHLDLWTSLVISVLGYKYYPVILDDFTHYLWTFPLKLKSDTFTTLSNSLLMCLISSAGRSKPSSATTGVSLTTLPPGSSSCRVTHSSGYRTHTHPRRIVKPNVSFVPLIMSSALCLSRFPFSGVIGLKDYTQLHTS